MLLQICLTNVGNMYVYSRCMCVCVCVCVCVCAATFVGGGFIVGMGEAVYDPTMGLTWAVMPVTGAFSFIVGKTLFPFFSLCDAE